MKNTYLKKTALVLGGGGFIGGHLAKKLKEEGYWVRIVDIKPKHEFWEHHIICDDYVCVDLVDPIHVRNIFRIEYINDEKDNKKHKQPYTHFKQPYTLTSTFEEVYQLAADMGGAGYVFTGENDANIMHNSAAINLNVAKEASTCKVKKIFYSSSACIYPEHNQLDPSNPNCEESSAYPANPDSEYGWEKLFSERLYMSFSRNYGLDVRIARFHNIFGPMGTWNGGKEKSPAAMCRKVSEANDGGDIEVWGDGKQTRSFLYVDDCVEAILRFMRNDKFPGPVNIGSEEMVTINELVEMVVFLSTKKLKINNLTGNDFYKKYGFPCPLGVKGRNSDNNLYFKNMGWEPTEKLIIGLEKTYNWINDQVKQK